MHCIVHHHHRYRPHVPDVDLAPLPRAVEAAPVLAEPGQAEVEEAVSLGLTKKKM